MDCVADFYWNTLIRICPKHEDCDCVRKFWEALPRPLKLELIHVYFSYKQELLKVLQKNPHIIHGYQLLLICEDVLCKKNQFDFQQILSHGLDAIQPPYFDINHDERISINLMLSGQDCGLHEVLMCEDECSEQENNEYQKLCHSISILTELTRELPVPLLQKRLPFPIFLQFEAPNELFSRTVLAIQVFQHTRHVSRSFDISFVTVPNGCNSLNTEVSIVSIQELFSEMLSASPNFDGVTIKKIQNTLDFFHIIDEKKHIFPLKRYLKPDLYSHFETLPPVQDYAYINDFQQTSLSIVSTLMLCTPLDKNLSYLIRDYCGSLTYHI